MSKFRGIIPALITPFNRDGSIYFEGLNNEIKYLSDCGYKNAFISGSYGSFPLLSEEERKDLICSAIRYCKQYEMKSIIQIGHPDTQTAVRLADYASDLGADAISAVVPFYYSSTIYDRKVFLKYFERIIKQSRVDVHFYNNPNTTGFSPDIEFIKELINLGVKGLKDGSADCKRMSDMLEIIDDDFDYYPSSTIYMLEAFLLGVKSCISGVALSVPLLIMNFYNLIWGPDKDMNKATALFHSIITIRNLLGLKSGRAIAAYDVLNWRGINVGTCREPWLPLDAEESEFLINSLKKELRKVINERVH